MLDIKYLRQNIDLVRQKMDERGQKIDFDRFLSLGRKKTRYFAGSRNSAQ